MCSTIIMLTFIKAKSICFVVTCNLLNRYLLGVYNDHVLYQMLIIVISFLFIFHLQSNIDEDGRVCYDATSNSQAPIIGCLTVFTQNNTFVFIHCWTFVIFLSSLCSIRIYEQTAVIRCTIMVYISNGSSFTFPVKKRQS